MTQKLTKHELRTMTVAMLLGIPTGMCADIFLPSMPAMTHAFDTTKHMVQLSVPYYVMALALAQLIFGPLSDKFGRKKISLLGVLIGLVGILFCAYAKNIHAFLIGRAISGIGLSTIPVCIRAIFSDLFEKERLAIYGGYAMLVSSVALLMSPMLGGYLQDWFGWNAAFIFLAGFFVVSGLIFTLFFTETHTPNESHSIHPAKIARKYFTVLTHRTFMTYIFGNASMFAMAMSFAAVGAFLFQGHYHLSPIQFGWLSLVVASAAIPGRFLGAKLTKQLGIDKTIAITYGITGIAGITLLTGFALNALNIWLIAACIFLCTLGQSIMYPNGFAGGIKYFRHMSGSAVAIQGSFQYFWASIVSAIVAAIAIHPSLLLGSVYAILSGIGLVLFRLFIVKYPNPVPKS